MIRQLPKNGAKGRHYLALPHGKVGRALETIRGTEAWPATKLAFEFLVLTATRSREVRLALWKEMDLDGAVWTIPGERMQANREHRVPHSSRAVEVLREGAEGRC